VVAKLQGRLVPATGEQVRTLAQEYTAARPDPNRAPSAGVPPGPSSREPVLSISG
jgi:hypothetical protein